MYRDGYHDLTNIDISGEVIKSVAAFHEKQGVACTCSTV